MNSDSRFENCSRGFQFPQVESFEASITAARYGGGECSGHSRKLNSEIHLGF